MLQFGGTAAAVALRGQVEQERHEGFGIPFRLAFSPADAGRVLRLQVLLEYPTCQPVCSLKLHLID